MPWRGEDHAPQILSLCFRAWEPQLPKPAWPRTHAPQRERSRCNEKHVLCIQRVAPALRNQRKTLTATKSSTAKIKQNKTKKNFEKLPQIVFQQQLLRKKRKKKLTNRIHYLRRKTQKIYCWCLVTKSCPTLCNPMDHSPPGSSVCGILQARIIGVGCHFPLQGIFLTQGSNPCLPHWQPD